MKPLQSKDDLTYHLTSHLRLNAVYWGFNALCIMGKPEALNKDEMVDFVMSCWDEEAGKPSRLRLSHSDIHHSFQVHLAPIQIMMHIFSPHYRPSRFWSCRMY